MLDKGQMQMVQIGGWTAIVYAVWAALGLLAGFVDSGWQTWLLASQSIMALIVGVLILAKHTQLSCTYAEITSASNSWTR